MRTRSASDEQTPASNAAREEEICAILDQQPVDLQALREISHREGGFLNSRLRMRIWPKLMGINRYQIADYRQYIDPHRDDTQVRCDVERSLWNNHEACRDWTDAYREKRRKALCEIIMAVLSRNAHLHYYQGFHDLVGAVMLLFEEDHLSFAVSEYIALHFVVDYMREDFDVIGRFMRFFFVIVQASDRELSQHMQRARLEPFFATSWLITWFSHDLHNLNKVSRLFDVLLSSHPIYAYYLAAAFVIELKPIIMETEPEFGAMHNVLVRAPQRHGFPEDIIIRRADELFQKVPISRVLKLCEPSLFELISANEIQVMAKPAFFAAHADSDQTLLDRMHLVRPVSYPLLRHYSRRLVSWGWITQLSDPSQQIQTTETPSEKSNSATSETIDAIDRPTAKGKPESPLKRLLWNVLDQWNKGKERRSFIKKSLFWSITVAIGGIISYALLNGKR